MLSTYFGSTHQRALSGFLHLPDEDPALFAVVIDYMTNGAAVFPWDFGLLGANLQIEDVESYRPLVAPELQGCIARLAEFLRLCAAYDVHEAGSAIYVPLSKAVAIAKMYGLPVTVLGDWFVKMAFDVIPDLGRGSDPVLVMLAREWMGEVLGMGGRVRALVRGSERFAKEVLRQILGMSEGELRDLLGQVGNERGRVGDGEVAAGVENIDGGEGSGEWCDDGERAAAWYANGNEGRKSGGDDLETQAVNGDMIG